MQLGRNVKNMTPFFFLSFVIVNLLFFLSFLVRQIQIEHEEGIVAMSSSVNGHQLLTMGGDELLCLWHWSETVQQSASKAGPLPVRSLLNPANLIR